MNLIEPLACASEVLTTVPPLMGALRANMHRSGVDVTVPQFRALAFLARQPGASSLSDLAVGLDLSLPAASKLIAHLVNKLLVARTTDAGDRRRVVLVLTSTGQQLLETAQHASQRFLAETLATVEPAERAAIAVGMQALRRAFAAAPSPAACIDSPTHTSE